MPLRLTISSLPLVILLLASPAVVPGQARSEHLDHLGLIGELTYYKTTSENHAIRVFNHKALPDSVKSEMVTRYNNLRTGFDQLILQLISDMQTRKRMGYVRALDKYFYKGKEPRRERVKLFLDNWNTLMTSFEALVSYPNKTYVDSMTAEYTELQNADLQLQENQASSQAGIKINPLDPIGSAGSLFSIYKRIGASGQQKVTNLSEMLNTLRFRNASELVADERELMETKMEGGLHQKE
jgi:hypothetical protein